MVRVALADRSFPRPLSMRGKLCSSFGSCFVFIQAQITLPNPASFSKNDQIPYFVVFTTQPRSKALCREIAADATIAVSLLRKVTVNIQRPCTIVSLPYSAPGTHQKGQSPPSAWSMGSGFEDSDSRSTATTILKRMVKSAPPRLRKSSSYTDIRAAFSINKELPALPPPSPPGAVAYTEARTLQTRMSIGFPKRPRSPCLPDEHPSLEAHAALPDGLHKGKVDLDPQLLPSIDWAGLNIKVSYVALGPMETAVGLIVDLELAVLHRCLGSLWPG